MTGLMVSMLAFVSGVKNKLESEKGATAVEYGLMVSLIAVAIIVAVGLLGTELNTMFTNIKTKIDSTP